MAYEYYVSIEGTAQGKFKGESDRTPYKDKIPGFSFQSAVASPRDAASGQATGKRRHEPVILRKKVGAATPMIAQALTKNEVLKTVLFEFISTTKDGKEQIFFTIKLSNATISAHRIYLPEVSGEQHHLELSEEVSFTFQKIEWAHEVAKTRTADDWTA